jgi:hypothetical protein
MWESETGKNGIARRDSGTEKLHVKKRGSFFFAKQPFIPRGREGTDGRKESGETRFGRRNGTLKNLAASASTILSLASPFPSSRPAVCSRACARHRSVDLRVGYRARLQLSPAYKTRVRIALYFPRLSSKSCSCLIWLRKILDSSADYNSISPPSQQIQLPDIYSPSVSCGLYLQARFLSC